ncbi:hypothetical protein ACFQ1T_06075 [Methylophilus glucosoxydans]|uniref:Lipoprotein n=1 Tax=Methylophilus glucosoxydans TaxID=752553 RepID=A0ABW3GG40_9PROT
MNIHSKYVHLIVLNIMVVMLPSCAIKARPYTPTDTGDVSYLRIVSPPGYELPETTYVYTYKSPDSCKGRYYLQGFKWIDKSSFSYIKINSGEVFALSLQPFWLGTNYGSRGCHVGVSFTPQRNRYYTAILKAKREDDYCYVAIRSSEYPNSELIDVPTERKEMGGSPMDEDSSFCK